MNPSLTTLVLLLLATLPDAVSAKDKERMQGGGAGSSSRDLLVLKNRREVAKVSRGTLKDAIQALEDGTSVDYTIEIERTLFFTATAKVNVMNFDLASTTIDEDTDGSLLISTSLRRRNIYIQCEKGNDACRVFMENPTPTESRRRLDITSRKMAKKGRCPADAYPTKSSENESICVPDCNVDVSDYNVCFYGKENGSESKRKTGKKSKAGAQDYCYPSKSLKTGKSICVPVCEFSDDDDSGNSIDLCFNEYCFSGLSSVNEEEKGTILMKDLKVGDRVLTSNGQYQIIYSFGHYHESKSTNFLQIYHSASKEPLEISSRHLVFLADKKNPIPASHINVGDKLLASHKHTSATSTVTKIIDRVQRDGLYAPLTADGTLVVNNVVVSNFVTIQDSEYAKIGDYSLFSYHFLYIIFETPHRLFCAANGGCANESFDKNGYNKWTAFGIRLANSVWSDGGSIFLVALIFSAAFTIFLPLYAFFTILMMPGALAGSVAAATGWYFTKKNFTFKTLKVVK